jgi:hypothetical protein
MPALASLAEFCQAVTDFPVEGLEVAAEPAARAEAERSVAESGFLLLSEVHGVWENPLIIRALLRSSGLSSLALKWPAELAPVISALLGGDAPADDPQLWSGDGRITAGHLAVLRERAAAGRLELTLLDGALPVGKGPADPSWSRPEAPVPDQSMTHPAHRRRCAGLVQVVLSRVRSRQATGGNDGREVSP